MTHRLLDSVETLEGVGEAYGRKLAGAGVRRVVELIGRDLGKLARRSGIPRELLVGFAAAAELLTIEACSPDLAEALVDAGITSLAELGECGLSTVERAVERASAAGRIRETPTLYRLADMQREAALLAPGGWILGKVLAQDGAPLVARITAANRRTETLVDGTFILSGLKGGRVRLTVDVDGRRVVHLPMRAIPHKVIGPLTLRLRAAQGRAGTGEHRESSATKLSVRATTPQQIVRVDLDAIPENAPLRVREIDETGTATLVHLHRARRNGIVYVEQTLVPGAKLPEGSSAGDLVRYVGGNLRACAATLRDIALADLARRIGASDVHVRVRRKHVLALEVR